MANILLLDIDLLIIKTITNALFLLSAQYVLSLFYLIIKLTDKNIDIEFSAYDACLKYNLHQVRC
jgi:hypothetical protein